VTQPLDQIASAQRPVGLERPPDLAEPPFLGGNVDPELDEPPDRVVGKGRLEQRHQPGRILGRDQMHGSAHHPGAQQGALLGAGPVHIDGTHTRASGPER
jgi:hypothetical protein